MSQTNTTDALIDKTPLTSEEAGAVLLEEQDLVRSIIHWNLWNTGLSKPKRGEQGPTPSADGQGPTQAKPPAAEAGPVPRPKVRGFRYATYKAVRLRIATDESFAKEIFNEITIAFLEVVQRGKAWRSKAPNLLAKIARRTARRAVKDRAAELFAELHRSPTKAETEGGDDSFNPWDQLSDPCMETPEVVTARRRRILLARRIYGGLTPHERKLMTAKEEGNYAELAEETATPPGTLRQQARRLRDRLAETFGSEYEPDPEQEEETCESRRKAVGNQG